VAYVVVCAVALFASGLTLLSGFGLGTLLLPAFALFFPVETAVAATAIVHLLNNSFKLALVGRHARAAVVVRFGIPALLAAFAGAALLDRLAGLPDLLTYSIAGRGFAITAVKAVIGALILAFSALELSSASERLAFGPAWLPAGGLVSGFFGGLSGHQGALRSAFLVRCGLTKERGGARGGGGGGRGPGAGRPPPGPPPAPPPRGPPPAPPLVIAATLSASGGVLIGVRVLKRVTLSGLRGVVGAGLILLALALGLGLV
jgi:uncharacterized membrane protein YfcA